ncbi:MAG TPA: hypothetical protein VNA25_10210, partial [Phycisphaerae bacterium]|nr:hypothetical protein [Phycisphaerae bacterium]
MIFPSTPKLIIGGLAVAALAIAGVRVYNSIYDAGFNAATVAEQARTLEAIDAAVQGAKADWKRSSTIANNQLAREASIRESSRVIARNIPAVVNSLDPACRDLGPDVRQLFNLAIAPSG